MSMPRKKCWSFCDCGPGRTCSPVAAHAGTAGCRLTLEEPVLPGLPASLPSCPRHLQTAQSQPARSFISPYLFTHFKQLLVRMHFLLPTAFLTALLMWFFSHLPAKICLMTAFSFLMAGDTANHYQSLQLASNLCVMQSKEKSLMYNWITQNQIFQLHLIRQLQNMHSLLEYKTEREICGKKAFLFGVINSV